jgi:hypothetical protein
VARRVVYTKVAAARSYVHAAHGPDLNERFSPRPVNSSLSRTGSTSTGAQAGKPFCRIPIGCQGSSHGEGRRRAKEAGVRFGRKPKLTSHQRQEALKRRETGESEGEESDADAGDKDRAAPRKTLAKKDARDIYTKLQAELDANVTRRQLNEWGEANAERIRLLPEDWQDTLRMRYQEHMLDLQNREVQHDADGVVWEEDGERPATEADRDDGLDIDRCSKRELPLGQEAGCLHMPQRQAASDQRHCARRTHTALPANKVRLAAEPNFRGMLGGRTRSRMYPQYQ